MIRLGWWRHQGAADRSRQPHELLIRTCDGATASGILLPVTDLDPTIAKLARDLMTLSGDGDTQVKKALDLAHKALHVTPATVSEEMLEACARIDVRYEVEQFCTWAITSTPKTASRVISRRLGQIAFEARVLHLRNLAAFLSQARPTKPYKSSDLVAAHYFADEWQRPKLLYSAAGRNRDSDVQNNLNRHLAHLTTDRPSSRESSKPFQWGDVDETLVLDEFLNFVSALEQSSHAYRGVWFANSRKRVICTLSAMRRIPKPSLVVSTTAEHDVVTGLFRTRTGL